GLRNASCAAPKWRAAASKSCASAVPAASAIKKTNRMAAYVTQHPAMAKAGKLDRVRNLGVVAHIDAGKTTVTERFLFYSGRIHKIGEVHEGDTQMDWMPEERQRGIAITAAAPTSTSPDPQRRPVHTPPHVRF